MVQIPAFCETEYFDNQMNQNARVVLLPQAEASCFADYCGLLSREGFAQRERRSDPYGEYAAFYKDGWGVFVNYFANSRELQLVIEENTKKFSYRDACGEPRVAPQVSQLKLRDYGMIYVIRLSDGRFLLIDSGRPFVEDADRLFACLKAGSPHEKPVIAAWVFTHAHSDHIYGFFPFWERHGAEVSIEKMLFCFPEPWDMVHYPALEKPAKDYPDKTGNEKLKDFLDLVAQLEIPVFAPHTGQVYPVGDTELLFLAGMEDTIHCAQHVNATSLAFSMELAGQKILWTGDSRFSEVRFSERYGTSLKADILQVPHHGFGSGTAQEQITAYELIRPRVCLLPASAQEAFTTFSAFRPGTEYLMTRLNIEELIVGDDNRTLTLPYIPHPGAKDDLARSYRRGRDDAGARTWVFTGLDTAAPEDALFTVLNMTYIPAEITAELFLGGESKGVRKVKLTAARRTFSVVNCFQAPGDPDAPFEQAQTPKNTQFCVRFLCSVPVVISHSRCKEAYRSSEI